MSVSVDVNTDKTGKLRVVLTNGDQEVEAKEYDLTTGTVEVVFNKAGDKVSFVVVPDEEGASVQLSSVNIEVCIKVSPTEGTPATTAGTPATTAGTPATTVGTPATTAGTPATTAGTPGTTAGTPGTTAGTPATTPGKYECAEEGTPLDSTNVQLYSVLVDGQSPDQDVTGDQPVDVTDRLDVTLDESKLEETPVVMTVSVDVNTDTPGKLRVILTNDDEEVEVKVFDLTTGTVDVTFNKPGDKVSFVVEPDEEGASVQLSSVDIEVCLKVSPTEGTPATTAGTPATTAGTPATTAGTPATTAGTPATTAGTPATTAGTPATTAGTPATTPTVYQCADEATTLGSTNVQLYSVVVDGQSPAQDVTGEQPVDVTDKLEVSLDTSKLEETPVVMSVSVDVNTDKTGKLRVVLTNVDQEVEAKEYDLTTGTVEVVFNKAGDKVSFVVVPDEEGASVQLSSVNIEVCIKVSPTEGTPATTAGTPATTAGTPATTVGTPATTAGTPATTAGTPGTTAGTPGTTAGTPATTPGKYECAEEGTPLDSTNVQLYSVVVDGQSPDQDVTGDQPVDVTDRLDVTLDESKLEETPVVMTVSVDVNTDKPGTLRVILTNDDEEVEVKVFDLTTGTVDVTFNKPGDKVSFVVEPDEEGASVQLSSVDIEVCLKVLPTEGTPATTAGTPATTVGTPATTAGTPATTAGTPGTTPSILAPEDCEDDVSLLNAVPSDVGQPGQNPFSPGQSDFIELEFTELLFVYSVTVETSGTFTLQYKDPLGAWVPYQSKIDGQDAPNGEFLPDSVAEQRFAVVPFIASAVRVYPTQDITVSIQGCSEPPTEGTTTSVIPPSTTPVVFECTEPEKEVLSTTEGVLKILDNNGVDITSALQPGEDGTTATEFTASVNPDRLENPLPTVMTVTFTAQSPAAGTITVTLSSGETEVESEEVEVSEGSNPVSVTFNKRGDNVKVDISGIAGVTVTEFVVKMCAEVSVEVTPTVMTTITVMPPCSDTCDHHKCLNNSQICNGVQDCDDGTDECLEYDDWVPEGTCTETCGDFGEQKFVRRCKVHRCENPVEEERFEPCNRHACDCVFSMSDYPYLEEVSPAWIQKNDQPGIQDDEIVSPGDIIDNAVIVFVGCNNCTCDNGQWDCTTAPCVGCVYEEWSQWTECSKTCDNGVRSRTKVLKSADDTTCLPEITEEEPCNTQPCPGWSSWGPWSDCSEDCNGVQTRTRTCQNSQDPAGCEGTPLESKGCNKDTEACKEEECAELGMVYTDCVKACPHTCQDYRLPASCVDDAEGCEPGCDCKEGEVRYQGQCVPQDSCACYLDDGSEIQVGLTVNTDDCTKCSCAADGKITCVPDPDCDRDCGWSDWSSWGECLCDSTKEKFRFRTPDNPPRAGNGAECEGRDNETMKCTEEQCPPLCTYEGRGYELGQEVYRTDCQVCSCTMNGSVECVDDLSKKINGGVSDWSEWSVCSRDCKGGKRHRTRSCDNPFQACGGDSCVGENLREEEPCNEDVPCCLRENWSDWDVCTDCEQESKRTRGFVDNPAGCGDVEEETKPCADELTDCKPPCVYSEWTDGECSVTCGPGEYERTRTVLEGEECPETSEFLPCTKPDCPCTEPNMVWSNYSNCEPTCENRNAELSSEVCNDYSPDCICEEGYVLVNDKCEPEDTCDLCRVGDKVYQSGDSFKDPEEPCNHCTCTAGSITCSRRCEEVVCSSDEILVRAEESGRCCDVCELRPVDTCSLRQGRRVLSVKGSNGEECQTKEPVTYTYCSGGCGDSEYTPMLSLVDGGTADSTCRCCSGVFAGSLEVEVECPGGETMTAKYPAFSGCQCDACAGEIPAY